MTNEITDEDLKSKTGYCLDFDKVIRNKLSLNKDPEKNIKAAIFAHSYPDPDAIGSMMGLAWLLHNHYGVECDLFYHGEISHPQNISMINLLDPSLRRVNEEYNAAEYQLNILADTMPKNAGIGTKEVNFDIVIDHHKESYINGYKGLFIHVKTGSCAAIIFNIMESLIDPNKWLNEDVDNDNKVATALIAGIVTDTEYMMSDDSTELEFDAFKKLFEYRNSNFLKQIVFFKRPKIWIDTKAAACGKAKIDEEGYAIVGLGLIPEKQRDIIADMADEMVTWASVETSIAFAVVGGENIVGCVRSSNASVNVSDLCKKLGGKFGNGGGKHGKGAYHYSLGGMSLDLDEDEESLKSTWEIFKERETKRICKTLRNG